MKRTLKVALMVAIAFATGVGVVYAVSTHTSGVTLDGDLTFTNSPLVHDTINMGTGDDTLAFSWGNDTISFFDGDDAIKFQNGNDLIDFWSGNGDILFGSGATPEASISYTESTDTLDISPKPTSPSPARMAAPRSKSWPTEM